MRTRFPCCFERHGAARRPQRPQTTASLLRFVERELVPKALALSRGVQSGTLKRRSRRTCAVPDPHATGGAPAPRRTPFAGDMEAITALVKNKKANHRGSIVNKKGHATVMNHKPDDLKALGLGSALKDIATPLHYAVVYGV